MTRVPSTPPPPDALRRPRRSTGGARHEATERVEVRGKDFETSGWTLNVSRGGVRAVVEDALPPGSEFELSVADGPVRQVRLVWTKDRLDGQIVGFEYLDVEPSEPADPPDPVE